MLYVICYMLYIHIYMMLFIYYTWDHCIFFKKDALKWTTKAQPVTMIANSEINENGIIFFHPSLVGPAVLLSLQKRGRGIRKI